jgi:chorismate mutase
MMDSSPPLPHCSSSIPTQDSIGPQDSEPTLEFLRSEIDHLDSALLALLAKRQHVVHAIGDYKRARDLPPLDQERWQSMLEARASKGEQHGLCTDFVRNIYEQIHEYSLRLESQPSPQEPKE